MRAAFFIGSMIEFVSLYSSFNNILWRSRDWRLLNFSKSGTCYSPYIRVSLCIFVYSDRQHLSVCGTCRMVCWTIWTISSRHKDCVFWLPNEDLSRPCRRIGNLHTRRILELLIVLFFFFYLDTVDARRRWYRHFFLLILWLWMNWNIFNSRNSILSLSFTPAIIVNFATTEKIELKCSHSDDFYLTMPNSQCVKYYRCLSHHIVQHECPIGMIFDAYMQNCVSESSKCASI